MRMKPWIPIKTLYRNKENLSQCLPFLLLETLFYMTLTYGT